MLITALNTIWHQDRSTKKVPALILRSKQSNGGGRMQEGGKKKKKSCDLDASQAGRLVADRKQGMVASKADRYLGIRLYQALYSLTTRAHGTLLLICHLDSSAASP